MFACAEAVYTEIIAIAKIISQVVGAAQRHFVRIACRRVLNEIIRLDKLGADFFNNKIIGFHELPPQSDLPFFHRHPVWTAMERHLFYFFLRFLAFFCVASVIDFTAMLWVFRISGVELQRGHWTFSPTRSSPSSSSASLPPQLLAYKSHSQLRLYRWGAWLFLSRRLSSNAPLIGCSHPINAVARAPSRPG